MTTIVHWEPNTWKCDVCAPHCKSILRLVSSVEGMITMRNRLAIANHSMNKT